MSFKFRKLGKVIEKNLGVGNLFECINNKTYSIYVTQFYPLRQKSLSIERRVSLYLIKIILSFRSDRWEWVWSNGYPSLGN
jgi:hypothetical protein